MTPAVIFGSINLAQSIAGYMGLIESVGGDVKKLLHQSLKSALQNLEYARSATGQNQLDYIRAARERFIDAISVEQNESLISAIVGLAMCQHLLGDDKNVKVTLDRINSVELTLSEKTKSAGLDFLLNAIPVFGPFHTVSFADARKEQFEEYKRLALATK